MNKIDLCAIPGLLTHPLTSTFNYLNHLPLTQNTSDAFVNIVSDYVVVIAGNSTYGLQFKCNVV